MCDYSLQAVQSRPAVVGEKLITYNFGTGTKGFRAAEEPCHQTTAICVLPGTELAFDKSIQYETPKNPYAMGEYDAMDTGCTTARFRQINKDVQYTHHDTLELSDGQMLMLNHLVSGQEATVLQLPAPPKNEAEAEEQRRVVVNEARTALPA